MSKCGAALAALFLLTTGAGALAQGHGAKPRERDAASVVKDGSSNVPNVEPHSQPAINDANYRIGPGDELNVNIWGDANLSRTVSVRPDGYISLPLLDDVLVSG
jgi:protein involved in polysaccharide export with SLBB domain